MIPSIATAISRLSSLSLALCASPIADPVRDRLDAKVRHFSDLVGWATITVALGVVLEGTDLALAASEWWKRKRREKREHMQLRELRQVVPIGAARNLSKPYSEEPPWVKIALRIGLILVVVGVVGEWRYGAKLEDAHDAVHEYDLGKILKANQKAGSAAQSAKEAHDLGLDLRVKYDTAERELTELKAAKLPRRLSSDQKDVFRRAVISFKGSTLDISCTGTPGSLKEPLDFELDFKDALGRTVRTGRKKYLTVEYMSGCNSELIAIVPPIQVEAGSNRTEDEQTLIEALAKIGINKKQITTKANPNEDFLGFTIGPKAP